MARNDQIVRILSVARALAASRRGVSLKALAAREGWPWRTVYRDKDALEAAHFPIEEVSKGRYRLHEDWAAPNLPGIEPDEIAAFYTLRALVESWRTTALGKPLDRLWNKISSGQTAQGALIPKAAPWFAVRSPMAIDYRAHAKIIATLDRAVRERLVVTCRYRALSTKQITARQIEPGELYWDPALESLYAIGFCRLRNAVRVFAAHRFVAATLTEQHFVPRAEARSRVALRDAFRIWRGNSVETVRVRFSPEAADEIRERRWGPGQHIEEEPRGGVLLTLEVAGWEELARWVLGFGGDAEVLAPEGLRATVADRSRRTVGNYQRVQGGGRLRTEQRLGARRTGGGI